MNKKEYLLTIGMPTYFDYSGAMFTVRALLEYHPKDIEIIVVDNTSDKKRRDDLKHELKAINNPDVKYFEFVEDTGPAEVKNKVFENASGEYVMCVDSHVLLETGVVEKLLQFLRDLPEDEKNNLFSGPLKLSNGDFQTEYIDVWRGEMWGIWHKRQEVLDSKEPVEAWANGCGLMLARKDTWLGFNRNFYGFGGEEGYIQEKYRKNGRKFKIIPWLKWWHRFRDPDARRFNLSKYAKVRNYVVGLQELGMDIQPVYDHFVNLDISEDQLLEHLVKEHSLSPEIIGTGKPDFRAIHKKYKVDKRDWDWILKDPIANKLPENTYIVDLFNRVKDVQNNDLKDHFETLKSFAGNVDTVLNVSRRKLSSVALAGGRPKKITSLLYSEAPFKWHMPDKVNMEFKEEISQDFPLDLLKEQQPHELVFFKAPHSSENLREYFFESLSKATKYFIVHDSAYNYKPEFKWYFKEMLNMGWYPVHHNNELWGLTVFSKEEPRELAMAWEEEDGPGNELKDLFKSYGFEATEGCGCNTMAKKMNFWGPEGCIVRKKEIAAFLEKNGKNWFSTEKPSWWTLTKLGWHAIKDKVNPLNPYEGFVDLCVSKYLERTKV